MMHAEKKWLAAAYVDGTLPGKTAAAAALADNESGLPCSINPAGPTFQVCSRDVKSLCSECEDTDAHVYCENCDEVYCALCWAALHRRGERAKHETTPLGSEKDLAPPPEAVDGSGWLAGVWPSQKPKPHVAAVRPAAAEAPSSSPSPPAPPSKRATLNGASTDGHAGGGPIPHTGVAAATTELVGNGTSSISSPNGPLAGNGSSKGNGPVAGVTTSLKKPKLNGSVSAAAAATPPPRPPPPPKAIAGASVAEAGTTPSSPHGACRKGSRRPEGHEGPLCPSGEFFSKPQTPPTSPSAPQSNGGAKRPRSPSLQALPASAGRPRGTDQSAAATSFATEASRGTTNGGGVGLDRNGGEPSVAEGRGQGRGLEGNATATADPAGEQGGGSGDGGSSSAAIGGVNGSNGDAGLHNGRGRTNGFSDSVASIEAAAPAGHFITELPPPPPEDMEIGEPLFSPAAIAAAAAAAGAGGRVDVEVPLLRTAASEKNSGGVSGADGASVGGDAAVAPAREATVAEQRSLADLKRRATNIPIRLDPRERAILGVLEGSLHHMQYTDAVDRILRSGRLPCVLENLKKFFTSVFGMYKASGVPLPVYSPPVTNNGLGGPAKRHGMPMPASRNAVSALPPPQGFGGSSSSSTNGGGGSGCFAADGNGSGKGAVAAGGAGAGAVYRKDSFVYKRTSWNYSLEWACILRTCCEVGRRHKILNPEKMRGAHGMLMCILMDTEHPQVVAQTGFSCVRPMRTAFGLSASTELMGLFEDPDLLVASRPVLPWGRDHRLQKSGRTAEEMAAQAKEKAGARRRLVARHGTGGRSTEVTLLVDSVADSIVYREISTRPIRRMISLLKHHWHPDRIADPSRKNISLAIHWGELGARLTHSHKTQFYFVLQSLLLWLEIVDHMLDLWAAGEKDMLDTHNQYNLNNTGQGLQRVQGASRVGKRMREYQARVNKVTGHPWVGSAVVHLGDNCVPNALTFLDKYSQVPWILNPILQALDYLSELDEGSDPAALGYVKHRWGSTEYAQRYILRNFFRFGFDGSGGDNNYDAGSCVDGRLTSAWNWCSKLEKKSFMYIFMLSGFSGFDGDFSR
eukprot:g14052.t1